jgi:hypothetical protein
VPRIKALDRFRAAALVLMLVQHFTEWLHGDPRSVLPGWDGFVVTDLAAPAFTIAAGASGVLLAEALGRKGWSNWRIDRTIVRRYGLLVPIGMGIHWLLWHDALSWGVLETLGLVVVVSTLVARRAPAGVLLAGAVLAFVGGPYVVDAFTGHGGVVVRILGDGFPVELYAGFAFVGAAAAKVLLRRGDDRVLGALVAGGLLALVVAWAALHGTPPDRHPGTLLGFIVPGLAGSFLVYAAVARVARPRVLDELLRRAARHTLGIFLGHYGIYALLRATGSLHELSGPSSVAAAVAAAVVIIAVAPYVPTLPWSPRTGVRQAPNTSASTSGTGRSSCAYVQDDGSRSGRQRTSFVA